MNQVAAIAPRMRSKIVLRWEIRTNGQVHKIIHYANGKQGQRASRKAGNGKWIMEQGELGTKPITG